MINKGIQEAIDRFVTDLSQLVREAAFASVSDALGAAFQKAPRADAKPSGPKPDAYLAPFLAGPGKAPGKALKAAVKAKKPSKGKRVRRTLAQIESDSKRIVMHVAAHPGQGAAEIKKALGLQDNEWSLPINMALESKKVSSKGVKRATRYFAGR